MKLLVIDTETGGLEPAKHSLLSIGAVVWSDGRVMDGIEVIVREPELTIDPEAMAVNKFDLARLDAAGRTPSQGVAEFDAFLERNFGPRAGRKKISVAGHNVSFDIDFFSRLYRLAGADFRGLFSHRVLDTASVLAFLILAGRLPPTCATSSEAFEHFGIKFEPKERHTALADARATAMLLDALLKSMN